MKAIEERRKAILNLEEAIQKCIDTYGSFENGEIFTDFVVIASGYRLYSPELDEDYEEGDDDLSVNHFSVYTRRGQSPMMSRGLLESALDRFRQ